MTNNQGGSASATLQTFSDGLKNASVVLTMVPIMCVYPFLQKYFVKGVTIGAVKQIRCINKEVEGRAELKATLFDTEK